MMMTQAYLERIRSLTFRQMAVPEPGPGEVLVRIHTALTCGTDLKTFRRGHAKLPVPGPLGHEASGTVVAMGRDVGPVRGVADEQVAVGRVPQGRVTDDQVTDGRGADGRSADSRGADGQGADRRSPRSSTAANGLSPWVDLSVGDPVMWAPTAPCGRCHRCEQRLFNHCETLFDEMALGTYADYILLPERIVRQHLFVKPEGLPFAEAALMEPLACILRGWRRLQADGEPIDSVLILGVGAIGLQHVAVAKALGVEQITVVGGRESGLEAAKQLGAHNAIAGHVPAVAKELQAAGLDTPDAVIECTGSAEVWAAAPSLVRIGGKALLFGGLASGTEVPFSGQRIHYDEVTLLGSFHYTTPDLVEAHRLLATGAVRLDKLISGTRPLSDLPDVFEELERGDGIKFALQPEGVQS